MPDEASRNPVHDSLQSTLDEHHGCMHTVMEVEGALARKSDPAGPWLSFLLQQLDVLRASLAEHFDLESDSALYREIPLKSPHVAARIDGLLEEHDTMLATLDELKKLGSELRDPEPQQVRELTGRVQVLIAVIRRHEAEENEIIMNAFWSEIGGGD